MANSKKPTNFYDGAKLVPEASPTLTEEGTLKYDSVTGKALIRNAASTDSIVQEAKAATLTNKTLTSPAITTPTGIVKGDVGLGNVDNTSDATKNAAAATLTNKTLTAPVINSPTGIVKGDVGLGNVDNTSDATKNAAAATLTNKIIDADSNTITNIENADIKAAAAIALNKLAATTASKALVSDASGFVSASSVTSTELGRLSGIGSAAVGASDTQTLSAKTFSDSVTLAEIATPSTPSSGYGRIYFKSDGRLYQLNDDGTESQVGAGSGGINYISANSDFESGTTGYAAYADAAAATPADGTGGAPTVTITRTTSSPLRGTGSGLITKDASNRQGEGVSYAFTISDADKAKVLAISFDYEIPSGTYADGDLTLYIYDVTNAVVIQPAGYSIANVGIESKHIATFQTASNSTSYRLIFHCASTSASAYTVKFDNVQVGPQAVQYGAPITDWTEYTPTMGSGFSTGSGASKFFWRRVGSDMEIKGSIGFGASSPALGTTFSFSLPAGYSMSETTTEDGDGSGGANGTRVGVASYYDSSAGDTSAGTHFCFMASSTVINVAEYAETGGASSWGGSLPVAAGASDAISLFNIKLPIAGWSSSVQMSNDTDTRVVAATYGTGTGTLAGADNVVKYTTLTKDTHGAYSTSTGLYTVPVPGLYLIHGVIDTQQSSGATYLNAAVYKTGVSYRQSSSIANGAVTSKHVEVCALVDCVAGDTLAIYSNTNGSSPTFTSGAGNNWMEITRVSGPSAIATTELVAARYTQDTIQSVANTGGTIVDYETKVFDTHNAVTTGASWKFTAPVSGKYRVHAVSRWGAQTWSALSNYSSALYKNGVAYSSLSCYKNEGSFIDSRFVQGTDVIQLNAGDYIQVKLAQDSTGGAENTNGDTLDNYINIERIGN